MLIVVVDASLSTSSEGGSSLDSSDESMPCTVKVHTVGLRNSLTRLKVSDKVVVVVVVVVWYFEHVERGVARILVRGGRDYRQLTPQLFI